MRPLSLLLLPLALAPLAAQAQAGGGAAPQRPGLSGPAQPQGSGWSLTIGVAPVLGPAWQGSKEAALSIFPDLRVNYRDILFASVPDGIGWNAVRQDGWRAGPLAKLRFGRNEDDGGSPFLIAGGSDALRGMGDLPATLEAGGFVEKQFGPRRQWRARVEVRQGLGGGHDGVVADLGLAYQGRTGRTLYTIGPRTTLASAGFLRSFYGIDAGQAQRTGLAAYRPDGGLVSVGLAGTLIRPIDRRSAITVFASTDYLGGEAGASPLIRERGSRFQATIGVGYGFRFSL